MPIARAAWGAALLTIGAGLVAGCEAFPHMRLDQPPLPKHVQDERERWRELGSDSQRPPITLPGQPGAAANAGGAHRQAMGEKVVKKIRPTTLEARSILPFVRYSFGEPADVKIAVDSETNSLILTGEARDNAIVAGEIARIDTPPYAGMHAALIEPEQTSASSFAALLGAGCGPRG